MAKRVPPAAFDDVAAAFADYGTTVRGYIRYQLTQRNLKPFLTVKKLRVLDVGGGSGADAAWLVASGHHVTWVEPSIEQRRFAERRFNFLLTDEERALVAFGGETLDDMAAGQQFDVVLVHAVALHQPDPEGFITAALSFVAPKGIVSIIEKGYYGTELRDIHDRNFSDLTTLHKTGRSINNLKQNVHTFKPEALEALLQDNHFTVEEWSGIRLITDDFDMPTDRISAAQLKVILAAEYDHGHHPAIRGQGQLLHFIARKND